MSLFAPLSRRTKFLFFFAFLIGGAIAVFYWLSNRDVKTALPGNSDSVELLPRRERLLRGLDELAGRTHSPQQSFGSQEAELDAMERRRKSSDQDADRQIKELDSISAQVQ